MRTVVVIPCRYASTRFPAKSLAPLRGASGEARTLVRRVWDAATAVSGVDAIYVATDDSRIEAEARSFGAEVVMTPEACRNGTERCAAALEALNETPDIIVNIQGDAPLTPSWFVEGLIDAMKADPAVAVATPVLRCTGETLAHFRADRAAGRVGGTTAAVADGGRALYFSKEVIPFTKAEYAPDAPTPVWHHVGVYAYRSDALAAYAGWPEGCLEREEGLEQLRFLENGTPIRAVEVEARGRVFWELNNPSDTPRIEAALREMGVA
ncbi:MAG: 3-deoxy-manno-octulosonate cytidylyltransferase [Rhodobacteraceae bacterium]|nr:3-deoxy-manno-octulosonate cytidylyltransferase [Paracoccaceae bacterium]